MDIDIGFSQIAGLVASSTTNYLIAISPILLLLGGLLLAMFVVSWLSIYMADLALYYRGTHAPGDFMSSVSGMNKADQDYYRSKEYPGNWNFKRFRKHQKDYRRHRNETAFDDE